jgi:hypothetical protein
MVLCVVCGFRNREGSKFCESCGIPRGLVAAAIVAGIPVPIMAFCESCGSRLEDAGKFCGGCGTRRGPVAITPVVAAAVAPDLGPKNGRFFEEDEYGTDPKDRWVTEYRIRSGFPFRFDLRLDRYFNAHEVKQMRAEIRDDRDKHFDEDLKAHGCRYKSDEELAAECDAAFCKVVNAHFEQHYPNRIYDADVSPSARVMFSMREQLRFDKGYFDSEYGIQKAQELRREIVLGLQRRRFDVEIPIGRTKKDEEYEKEKEKDSLYDEDDEEYDKKYWDERDVAIERESETDMVFFEVEGRYAEAKPYPVAQFVADMKKCLRNKIHPGAQATAVEGRTVTVLTGLAERVIGSLVSRIGEKK